MVRSAHRVKLRRIIGPDSAWIGPGSVLATWNGRDEDAASCTASKYASIAASSAGNRDTSMSRRFRRPLGRS